MPSRYGLEVGGSATGETRLRVSGEVDLVSAPPLLDSILCAGIAAPDGQRIIVDLGDVSFIDSSGLAALVDANRRLADRGQQLVVANPGSGVWRIFTLAGIDQILVVDREPTVID
ncbi:MAG: STAS domain-containing protein [Acidimicrobiales bacterium]